MTLRFLADQRWDPTKCMHPEHGVPSHLTTQPGHWEWECPRCGHRVRFTVPR